LYNGFLAVGLIWTFFIEDPIWKINISIFFLGCMTVAGIFGAFFIGLKIFFVQVLSTLLALVVIAARI